MSTQTITNPPVLDTTGQAIVTALNNLTEATSPTNVYIDIPLSIPVSGWDNNTPHVYTWMNENIVGNCGIEVGFADGAEDVATTFIRVTKIVGGIKFSIDEVPSAPIPLIVRIINAKADSVIGDIDATMVETSAISGVTNVEEALTDLDGRVDDNAYDIASNSSAIAKVQNGLAHIVGDTNTTGETLAVGQFVYVKGHSTITGGLRKVTADISANDSITTNNTTECSEGGLNALNDHIGMDGTRITTGVHTYLNSLGVGHFNVAFAYNAQGLLYASSTDCHIFIWDSFNHNGVIHAVDASGHNYTGLLSSGVLTWNDHIAQLVTITAKTGFATLKHSLYQTGEQVSGAFEIKNTSGSSVPANTWTTIGTVSKPAYSEDTSSCAPAVDSGSGAFAGMVTIDTSGNIKVYSPTAISSNHAICASVSYKAST